MTPTQLLRSVEEAGGVITVDTNDTIICRKIPKSLAPLLRALSWEEIAAALKSLTVSDWVASNTRAGRGYASSARILYREYVRDTYEPESFEKFVAMLAEMAFELEGDFLTGVALATDLMAAEFWQQQGRDKAVPAVGIETSTQMAAQTPIRSRIIGHERGFLGRL